MPTVQVLLDGGADVNGRSDGGKTPLMIAAMFNRTGIVEALLGRGADVQARDAGGLTAEALASAMGAADAAELLGRSERA
jgi:ankyrin repeat protein